MYMIKLIINFVFTGVLLCGGCSIGLSDRSLSFLTPEGVSILLSENAGTLLDANAGVVIVDPRRKEHTVYDDSVVWNPPSQQRIQSCKGF